MNIKKREKEKVIFNIFWLFFDKVIRMGFGVFVLILLARYLGPEQYGLINYSQSLVAIALAISGFGLYGIMVRDLVITDDKYTLLGTAFTIRFVAAIVAYIGLMTTIIVLRPEDQTSIYIVAILGFSLFFNTSDIVRYWYESQVNSRYTVFVENSVFMLLAAIKLLMIYFQCSVIAFVYAFTVETALSGLLLFFVYSKQEKLRQWQFSWSKAKGLLKDSWPLIISAFAWIVYTRIDQIMIGQMLGDKEVGLYSAATRLSDVANFFPMIIASSIIPAILKHKDSARKIYEQQFQDIYYLIITIMVFLAIFTLFFADDIISLLYGNAYIASSSVLKIHFWVIVFNALAVISGKYFINDDNQMLNMSRHTLGVILNIPLNYFLIPTLGIEGAAIATLASSVITYYFFDLFSKKSRKTFIFKTKALLFFWVFERRVFTKTFYKP